MGSSILERSSRPPTRTASKTSRAFRSNQNDFSPFGSLAELNAATHHNMMLSPRGSKGQVYGGSGGGGPGSRVMSPNTHHSTLGPTPEKDDDMGSFYGEETDYGNVTHQLHPDDAYLGAHGDGGRSYRNSHAGSQFHPSQAGSGWGSRAGSASARQMDTPLPQHLAYSDHGDHHSYAAQNWPGSRAGTNHGHHDDFDDDDNHVPTIQVHPEDQEYMYPQMPARSKSSRATIHHPRAPSTGINHDEDEPWPDQARTPSFHPPARTKSSKASVHRAQSILPKPSRATIRSFARPGALPAHFETDGDNVILQVWLPWTERLNERPCRFHITGVDGKKYSLEIDYRWMKAINGTAKFRGAGMPRDRGLGRGHLIIEWEIWFDGGDDGSLSDE